MFKQRLITALVLAPCLLAVVLLCPPWVAYVAFLGVLVLAAREWLGIIPVKPGLAALVFISAYVVVMLAVHYYHPCWIIYLTLIWLPIVFFILIYPKGTWVWAHIRITWVTSLIVTALFAFAMQGIYALSNGNQLILFLFFLVWSADIGAYLFGKRWGATKLIPKVSPGKSWEGFFGGMVCVTITGLLGAKFFNPPSFVQWLVLVYGCFVLSIFGDLFISMLKRKSKLKDTGHLLPGHGGVLDRLDSMISSAPLFYVGLHWTNVGF